jgi:hypothetical protein
MLSCIGDAVGAAVAFDELPDDVCAIAPVAAKSPAVLAMKSLLYQSCARLTRSSR